MGSAGIAAVVAQLAFWILLVLGIVGGQLSRTKVVLFVVFWLFGSLGLPRLAWWASSLVISWIAVLDIVLVFIVCKGDVRLT
jgi:hypothetical protein